MKIICISGKARHGKDTAATLLKSKLETDGNRVLIVHYADLLKHICRSFFGWNGEKDEAGRALLQRVGTDVIRAQCPDFWVGFVAEVLRLFPDEWDYAIIPDCRFPNEISYLRQAGFNTIHIRVARSDFESPLTPEQQRHPSETALDACVPDYILHNDGTLADLSAALAGLTAEINGHHQLSLEEIAVGQKGA